MRFLAYITFLLISSSALSATVQFPAINELTKEYAIIEDGGYMPIGWKGIPEKEWKNGYEPYRKLGYSKTNFTYKIEIVIFFMLSIILLIVALIYKISNKPELSTPWAAPTPR